MVEFVEQNWLVVIAGVVVVLGVVRWAFNKWRQNQVDKEGNARLYDLVQVVINKLYTLVKEEAQEIDTADVMEAAAQVYAKFIQPTALAVWISEQEFVNIVVGAWEDLVGIEQQVAVAVAQRMADRASTK